MGAERLHTSDSAQRFRKIDSTNRNGGREIKSGFRADHRRPPIQADILIISAEDIQIQIGRLENDIEQYARVKIASKVLNQAIERYRDKSQGPILSRASALFQQITGGSFEGIRAEFDDNGKPMLVGVRTNGAEIVSVDGMSDGTADQLYLALRLAGLEDYLDKNEPIPFIVDDILIKFDDVRAAATLQALSKLSANTQVIFFTHHRHLVELAEKNVDSTTLIKHHLEA